MKTTWKAAKQKLAALGLAALMVCCTGCDRRQATQNSIAIGKNIDIRTNLAAIKTPKEAGLYNFTRSFADIDPEGLAKLMMGTDTVITGENTSGVYYRRADNTDETKGSVKVTVDLPCLKGGGPCSSEHGGGIL